ncbi:U-box domain-containing protein 35-like [Cynara cardunculus var. scolymus]|uniref:U-box domain-containing protein 35-like n=1 Tax=Cynara cardunculus var. scolymus TaxID=59895 RepID=UPI000D62E270|nr:U-box domain-containing protein 35-like [Cynara cardunculus var. scolymus]
MWLSKSSSNFGHSVSAGNGLPKCKGNSIVAIAIDKDKNSQHALKWVVEQLINRGQSVVLIHVHKISATGNSWPDAANKLQNEKQIRDLFLSFHCFCTRKQVQCIDVVLEDTNVPKALAEYASQNGIEYLVLGASSRHGFIRFKTSDVPSHVMKVAPDFCTIYVISKGKISSAKKSLRPAPFVSPLIEQIQEQSNTPTTAIPTPTTKTNNNNSFASLAPRKNSFQFRGLSCNLLAAPEKPPEKPRPVPDELESFISPFTRPGRAANAKLMSLGDLPESDTDISFVSSGRPSIDRVPAAFYNDMDLGSPSCFSTSSDYNSSSPHLRSSSQNVDEGDMEMKRLKMELMKRMDLYSIACKEAVTAREKAGELHQWQMEEQHRLEEEARVIAEKEKAKGQADMEKAEAARRIAELESQKRVAAEMQAFSTHVNKEDLASVPDNQFKYRRYTIEEIEEATEFFAQSRKIGEGGYGPVFRGSLNHTPVAIKVLRPDAAQGRSQFQQEVEVLSCMRHPNMVLLLGACPEYGCLVYEYMANGSLEDRLHRRGNTPPLSWQIRFKIASEIATGILFLHQTKPEPIVHRDLKPGNILLDQNFVSKISDVGLARLLPPSVTEDITQYRMTSTAGTFCYIDPEYQQTGMLRVKSDVYSLGIMLLQLITAKPAMGLSHHVENAIDDGTFGEMLDPSVPDWPQDEALGFAKLALQCAELRRKDRPDLGKVVLPELVRLRDLGEESIAAAS